jgi:bifunctional DNA-binding transcriptional regulator/antitoxin component of YhaV-PrlF toxin-antitoxin module
MKKVHTIVEVDDQGRLRLPPAIRKAIKLTGAGLVEIEVEKFIGEQADTCPA